MSIEWFHWFHWHDLIWVKANYGFYNKKTNLINISNISKFQGRQHRGGQEVIGPPLFCAAKRKKGNKGKKERISKQKLLKSCHQGQNITVLAILERLELKNISYPWTMVANNTFQCSIVLHFEIHFVGPDYWQKSQFCSIFYQLLEILIFFSIKSFLVVLNLN